ncbi:hypothetical protein JRQ81_015035 [Phrynocephalus forsythii]|uniref:Transposase n=1 Tax=Phrynocephalus forsythii TaxID=171643 RepID=A0A9Q0XYU7_9SAUR|nr:hypothetical protein JRQ81_015035 [Phrynocephalus forsythii]
MLRGMMEVRQQSQSLPDLTAPPNTDVGALAHHQSTVAHTKIQGIELEGELERAHRLQSKRTGGEPRPVIVKFAREKTQQQVFLALKKMKELNFKGKKIFVRRDFCPETLKQKSLMKPYAQKLHQNKIKFSWIYPNSTAIFKEGKRLLARNPQEAAKLLVKLKLDIRDLEDQTSMDEEEGEEGPSTCKEKRQRMHSDEGL